MVQELWRYMSSMSVESYVSNPLWQILVDTVHTMVMFKHHKAYVRDVVMVEHPDITAEELAQNLNISLGESLVILHEVRETKNGN